MRTLLISDLHLGSRLSHDVLRRPEPLKRLLHAVGDLDRLVLLGDTVELMEGRPEQAMSIAEPILRSVGQRLKSGSSVVIVPGNHDRPLVRGWVRQRAADLGVDTTVPPSASPLLERLVSWFEGSEVEVHYPGFWLADRVWATHGHYLDGHLLPRSAVGIRRGMLRRLPRDEATPGDYERGRRPSTTRINRWLPRPVAAMLEDLAELTRASTMPQVRRHMLRRRAAPLTSRLLSFQMRRASIPAIARVVHRLRIDADWVVFGHVHRVGPLADDEPSEWAGPDGRMRFANTGSWLYEPALLHRAGPSHPYWPGGAVLIDDGGVPQALNLLQELDAAQLR